MTDPLNPTDELPNPEVEQPSNQQPGHDPLQDIDGGDDTPPVKKTPQEYILERKARQAQEAREENEKLKARIAELENSKQQPETDGDVPSEYLQHTMSLERRFEIKEFVSENPEFKPYADKMLKWSQHNAYSRVPVEQLAYAVAGPSLIRGSTPEAQAAQEEAATSRVSGGAVVPPRQEKKVDYSSMTDAEFAQHVQNAKRGL